MEKMIIYQVLPRLFGNACTDCRPGGTLVENGCGKMSAFTPAVLRQIRMLGATHVWYTGMLRHATTTDYTACGLPRQHADVVKGKAGSPYAIADYYDIDPDLADKPARRSAEFDDLVKRTHDMGLKVVLDFVPNHVAREYHSVAKPAGVRDLGEDDDREKHFSAQNNFYYCCNQPFLAPVQAAAEAEPYSEFPARATGNDVFRNNPSRNDWYETVKLNYGVDYCDMGGRSAHFDPVPDTWHKMTDILRYWAGRGADAFRCDMAEMVPSAFWRYATAAVRAQYPGVEFIGEVYNPTQYREYIAAGFDFLYDKVGLYDTLRDVMQGRQRAAAITWRWQETDDIKDHMLYFLENHDEQRIASDFFCGDARPGVPGMIVSALLGTNPAMVYCGQEFGERGMDAEGFSGRDGRTTIFDYWALDTVRRGFFQRRKMTKAERDLAATYSRILNVARGERAATEGLLFDLMYANTDAARFDSNRLYTFLRKAGHEMLLVVANFAAEDKAAEVCIPAHAFDYLGIKPQQVIAVDLLSGQRHTVHLAPDAPVKMSVPAYGGCVWRMDVRG